MRIIDAHAHLIDQRNYLEKLIDMMDNCGIKKCCLLGLRELFLCKNNDDVEKAFNQFPKRIIAMI